MEKLVIEVRPDANGEVPANDVLLKAAQAAGWSDDPGEGKAVLLPDERGAPGYEVLNPLPFAPPIGFTPTPPIEQLIRDRVALEVARLRDEDEIDDILDAEDFDIPDELPPLETIYEFISMTPEAPEVKSEPSLEDRAKADAEYEEHLERARVLRKRHRKAELDRRRQEEELLYGDDPPPADKGLEVEKGA